MTKRPQIKLNIVPQLDIFSAAANHCDRKKQGKCEKSDNKTASRRFVAQVKKHPLPLPTFLMSRIGLTYPMGIVDSFSHSLRYIQNDIDARITVPQYLVSEWFD